MGSSIQSANNPRNMGLIPGSGRSPGIGNGNTLQYSCLGNPMDRGTWQATVHGVTELDMTEHARTLDGTDGGIEVGEAWSVWGLTDAWKVGYLCSTRSCISEQHPHSLPPLLRAWWFGEKALLCLHVTPLPLGVFGLHYFPLGVFFELSGSPS